MSSCHQDQIYLHGQRHPYIQRDKLSNVTTSCLSWTSSSGIFLLQTIIMVVPRSKRMKVQRATATRKRRRKSESTPKAPGFCKMCSYQSGTVSCVFTSMMSPVQNSCNVKLKELGWQFQIRHRKNCGCCPVSLLRHKGLFSVHKWRHHFGGVSWHPPPTLSSFVTFWLFYSIVYRNSKL